ncbi:glycoside hydrolase family 11 protein [Mucilaginibacter sp. AW1-3]
MRKNNFLPEVARKVTFGAAIIAALATSTMFTGCKKESAAEPELVADQPVTWHTSSGYVQDDGNRIESSGTSGGFFWQCYFTTGSASITQGSAGNFSSTYSNVGDVVVGKGYNPGSAGTRGYNVGALSGSYNNVGIYGWTTSPLIEYYVTEFGSVATGSVINTISSDGHNYNFYKHQQVNQPSIQGTATFWQYLDNWGGSSKGANHTVTMANHINNWKSHGGQGFGSYNLEIFALEAYGGKSGSINATVW